IARRHRGKVRGRCRLAGRPGGGQEKVGPGPIPPHLGRVAPCVEGGDNVFMRPNLRPARGFTMVELMIVVGVMGIIASIAIPNYQKLTARSRRTEMLDVVSKFRLYFKNIYDNYYYLEVFHGNGTSEVTEFPPAF